MIKRNISYPRPSLGFPLSARGKLILTNFGIGHGVPQSNSILDQRKSLAVSFANIYFAMSHSKTTNIADSRIAQIIIYYNIYRYAKRCIYTLNPVEYVLLIASKIPNNGTSILTLEYNFSRYC